jgi:Fe-S-cluster-containing hydrogenase component 2
MRLWMDPAKCTGCLRCELACSFHHSGRTRFQPELSSIRVSRSNVDKSVRMTIDDSCDGCASERSVLCVRACVFNALGTLRREAA